jgi:ankyrin repeat protein
MSHFQRPSSVYEEPGLNSLEFAVNSGNLDDVRRLLNKGVNPDLCPINADGYTVVQMAVRNGRWREARELFERSHLLDVKDSFGRTLMHLASMSGSTHTVETVWCNCGGSSDINSQDDDGNTPLHLARYYRDEKMCDFLRVAGATINIENRLGLTPGQIYLDDLIFAR